jgi:hypothetical protein
MQLGRLDRVSHALFEAMYPKTSRLFSLALLVTLNIKPKAAKFFVFF